jgi:hypothetical protein
VAFCGCPCDGIEGRGRCPKEGRVFGRAGACGPWVDPANRVAFLQYVTKYGFLSGQMKGAGRSAEPAPSDEGRRLSSACSRRTLTVAIATNECEVSILSSIRSHDSFYSSQVLSNREDRIRWSNYYGIHSFEDHCVANRNGPGRRWRRRARRGWWVGPRTELEAGQERCWASRDERKKGLDAAGKALPKVHVGVGGTTAGGAGMRPTKEGDSNQGSKIPHNSPGGMAYGAFRSKLGAGNSWYSVWHDASASQWLRR